MTSYARPGALDQALELLARPTARPRSPAAPTCRAARTARQAAPATLVDIRPLLPAASSRDGDGLRIGAGTTLAGRVAREPRRRRRVRRAARRPPPPRPRRSCATSARSAATWPRQVRCWYYRHPDLTCWLNGGDTCYAQIGDHRKHGLEAGDCISVAPSDLAGPLAALGASVTLRGAAGRARDRAARPVRPARRCTPHAHCALEPGELIVSLRLPGAAGRLALRARGRARRVVVRARRASRLRAVAASSASSRSASRTSRASSTLPIRCAASTGSSRRAGSGGCSRRSVRARSQPPRPSDGAGRPRPARAWARTAGTGPSAATCTRTSAGRRAASTRRCRGGPWACGPGRARRTSRSRRRRGPGSEARRR